MVYGNFDYRGGPLAALAAAALLLPSAAPIPPGREAAIDRSTSTLAATERMFGTADGSGLYHETYPQAPKGSAYGTEWPFSQVHIGVLDLAQASARVGEAMRDSLHAHQSAQQHYWTQHSRNGHAGFLSQVTPPYGNGGDLFYDDNEWVGLAAIQHWLIDRDVASLVRARKIFQLIRSAWDDDPEHPSPGGLFWTQAPDNHDRNTVSNMPAAELGVRLFEATGDQSYLRDTLRYYSWTNRTLQRPDGLYFDHIDLAGRIDHRIFSYNQGVPIGVNVLLYKATGDDKYLTEARRIAAASQAYFIGGNRLEHQPVPFNAIYFKNLLLLESVVGGSRYRREMQAYSDRMWRRHRDPKTGLFRSPGRERGAFRVIDQGAMIQIDAVLGWDPARYALLY